MSINVKTAAEIEIMAVCGQKLVQILKHLKQQIIPGTSLKTLDQMARDAAKEQGGQPTFLGYQGYPAAICASVNEGIVHCIPTDYQLQEGDLISIDFGFCYQGWNTDAAITWIVGEDIHQYRPLLKGVYQALRAGVGQVRAGVRVGEISQAIEDTLRQAHLTIMRQFVGHGVGRELHEDPVIPNFVGHDKKVVLPSGSTIAIEPIAGVGGEGYITLPDQWSVYTTDKQPVAHFEETVVVLPEGAKILTPIQEILDFTP
ncbi:MAG: type I methionyl aminopeptidase [Patescibacteria group bacterium]|jgi:methionyl aminopeptidase